MSFIPQISPNRLELAKRIAGDATAPEDSLRSIYKGAFIRLEELLKTAPQSSVKERVWTIVSRERLPILKETLISAFCENILFAFEDKEISEMLEEHKRTGFVKNSIYSGQIQVAYFLKKEIIINTVVEKANSMTDDFIPDIVAALQDEKL